jgi:hypothetical protein
MGRDLITKIIIWNIHTTKVDRFMLMIISDAYILKGKKKMIKIIDLENIKLCSINKKYYKNFNLTQEYRDFKLLISLSCKNIKIEPPYEMKIEVSTAMDIDAPIKPILDGLNGQAIDDDRNILKLTVIKEKIKRGEFGSLKIFVKSLKKD